METLYSNINACRKMDHSIIKNDLIRIFGTDSYNLVIDKIDEIIREYIFFGKGSPCNLFNSAIDAFQKTLKEIR